MYSLSSPIYSSIGCFFLFIVRFFNSWCPETRTRHNGLKNISKLLPLRQSCNTIAVALASFKILYDLRVLPRCYCLTPRYSALSTLNGKNLRNPCRAVADKSKTLFSECKGCQTSAPNGNSYAVASRLPATSRPFAVVARTLLLAYPRLPL